MEVVSIRSTVCVKRLDSGRSDMLGDWPSVMG